MTTISQTLFLIPYLDFLVTTPAKGDKWVNGQTYALTWEKGLLDGIPEFDLELTRMNADGILFVARNGSFHSTCFSFF